MIKLLSLGLKKENRGNDNVYIAYYTLTHDTNTKEVEEYIDFFEHCFEYYIERNKGTLIEGYKDTIQLDNGTYETSIEVTYEKNIKSLKRSHKSLYDYLSKLVQKEMSAISNIKREKMNLSNTTDIVEKSENDSIQFHPQATAIKKGNSVSAKMLIEDIKSTKEKILDYGLGIGRNLQYIADNTDLKLYGVDIMEQIQKEKESHDILRSQGHIIEPTEKNNLQGFDKILNSHVLNVVDSDEEKKFIVADIYNKLNNGGKAYIEVRTKADVESAKTKEKYKDGYKIKKGSVYTYQEGITKEKMINLVTSVGFKVNQHIYNSSKHIIVCEK